MSPDFFTTSCTRGTCVPLAPAGTFNAPVMVSPVTFIYLLSAYPLVITRFAVVIGSPGCAAFQSVTRVPIVASFVNKFCVVLLYAATEPNCNGLVVSGDGSSASLVLTARTTSLLSTTLNAMVLAVSNGLFVPASETKS